MWLPLREPDMGEAVSGYWTAVLVSVCSTVGLFQLKACVALIKIKINLLSEISSSPQTVLE